MEETTKTELRFLGRGYLNCILAAAAPVILLTFYIRYCCLQPKAVGIVSDGGRPI
jgi:hypothetical protein